MRSEDTSNKAVIFAAIVFVLFGTYVSYATFLTGQPKLGMPWTNDAAAKDGEDSGDSEDSKSEDDNEDDSKSEKDKNDDKAAKEAEKKKKEAAKEAAKKQQEAAKRSAKQSSSTSSSTSEDDGDDEMTEVSESDQDEDLAESEENSGKDEEEAMYKDKAKTLERINKKLAQAEEKILKKQAEGVDVTAALAALAQAKEKATGVDALFVNYNEEAVKALTKETEELAHAARGKVLHAAEKVSKDVSKVDKRIAQAKEKIAALTAAGGDASSYSSRLAELETEWAGVKAKIAAGGSEAGSAYAMVETLERRVKSVKSAVENALLALGVSDDDEFEVEHVAEVEDASDDIDDLAEIEAEDEDDINDNSVKRLTQSHREGAAKAVALKSKFESRSAGMKQLFGDDTKTLAELRAVIVENDTRIEALEKVVSLVDDPEVAAMMNEKLSVLKEQNTELENYVASRPVTSGMFGWLFNWF
jgi:hypothetical protein